MYRLFFANKAGCRDIAVGFVLFLAVILMPACDGGSTNADSETGSAVFSLQWPDQDQTGEQTTSDWQASDDMISDQPTMSLYAAGNDECQAYGVTMIICDVYDENETWMGGDSFACSAHGATVKNISAGENLRFVIKALDDADIVLYEAEVTDTISPGKTTDLGIVKLWPAMPESVNVPNVVNMTDPAAESAITSAGLTTGSVAAACDNTIEDGSVISSNPAAGISVPPGTTVDLVVSTGPCPGPDSCDPITEGNTWTYRFKFPDTETVTGTTTITSYTDPWIYFQHVGYDLSTGWESTIETVSLITQGNLAQESVTATSVMDSGETMEAFLVFEPAQPYGFRDLDKQVVGAMIQGTGSFTESMVVSGNLVPVINADYDTTVAVVDDEVAVEVPAGHFDNAIMVTITTTNTFPDRDPSTNTTTEWWVCGIGYVKAVDSESGAVTELESYSVEW